MIPNIINQDRERTTDNRTLSLATRDIRGAGYNINKPTKFVTHGWLSSGDSDTCIDIKDAYLLKEDVNVIILDWGNIAGNIFYPIAKSYTKRIGDYYAQFIDYLVANGAHANNMHLIGHSLGAHVSGFAGRAISKGTIGRITALDPAKPGFVGFKDDRLLPSDANFVDVIHTCGGVLGIKENVGDADFYPNGGTPPQPGCFGVAQLIEACSHGRSWEFFAESIAGKNMFMSQKCESWKNYQKQSCEDEFVPMGNPAPSTARGSYYLETEPSPPYAKVQA